MSKLFLSFLVLFFPSIAFSAEISWEVDHPFRFLRYKSDHLIHEMAYKTAKQKNPASFKKYRVSEMEALLNSKSWWSKNLSEYKGKPIEIISSERAKENRSPNKLDMRHGWSALLRSRSNGNIDNGTCWDAHEQNYFGCRSNETAINGSDDYAHPKAHFVKISIKSAKASDTCQLRITNKIRPGTGFIPSGNKTKSKESSRIKFPCDETVLARVPYKSSIIITGRAGDKKLSEEIIKVRDILIASMGDSFSSGEGNPDLPATLENKKIIKPRNSESGIINDNFGIPTRELNRHGEIKSTSSARWLDRRCHRSMYSSHTRAAIALALSGDRHHAVTYLSQSCSGAEITDGIFWPQDGRECSTNIAGSSHYLEPQISSLVAALGQSENSRPNLRPFTNSLEQGDRYTSDVLNRIRFNKRLGIKRIQKKLGKCNSWPGPSSIDQRPRLRTASFKNDREIDLLMLSIGGNDMGFSSLVASIALRGAFTSLGDKLEVDYSFAADGISLDTARNNIRKLDGRFEMLAKAVKSKLEINDPKNVLLTSYPTPAFNANGDFCNTNRKGMNVSRLLDLAGPTELDGKANIKQAQGIVTELNSKIKNIASKHNFTFVNSFEKRFKKHGICAQKAGSISNAEKLDIPYKKSGSTNWNVFNPITEFYPYEKRQRWFRTFNDSYLSMFHFKENAQNPSDKRLFNLQRKMSYLASRTLGGPVHPSAEGHAAIADSIYCSAAKKLFPQQKSAQCK